MKIIEFVTAVTLLTLMPGPDIIFVITQSMSGKVSDGIKVSLGLCTGLLVDTTLLALGVGLLVSESIAIYNSIKILGI